MQRTRSTILKCVALTALTTGLAAELGSTTALACFGWKPAPTPVITCSRAISTGLEIRGPLRALDVDQDVVFPVFVNLGLTNPSACPGPPYLATITIDMSCDIGPGASSTITVPIAPGSNTVDVPFTIPAGPARECVFTSDTTVAFVDGISLSKSSPSVAVCIVETLEDQPDTPRLQLELMTPGIEIAHGGDQRSFGYLLTNNDTDETWTGSINALMRNAAGLASETPAIGSAYSFADVGPGDNFPMAFADELGNDCLILPPDPLAFTLSEIERDLVLPPGESEFIEIVARSWGPCGDGSCGQKLVTVEGTYSDGTQGKACTASVFAVDSSVAPDFAWPDSGRTAQVLADGKLVLIAEPSNDPTDSYELIPFLQPQLVLYNGQELGEPFFQPMPLTDVWGRIEQQHVAKQPIFGGGEVNVQFGLELFGPGQVEILDAMVPDQGKFENTQRAIKMRAGVDLNTDGIHDSFFDIMYQVEIGAELAPAGYVEIQIEQLQLVSVNPMVVELQGLVPAGDNQQLLALQAFHDIRGYATLAAVQPPCNGDIDGDGIVSTSDLLILLANWGPNPGSPADLNGDGVVDTTDLLILLSNWGGC